MTDIELIVIQTKKILYNFILLQIMRTVNISKYLYVGNELTLVGPRILLERYS